MDAQATYVVFEPFITPSSIPQSKSIVWLTLGSTAQRKPVAMNAVAKSILYLASDAWSGHVHGQILNVDSGKQGKVMWTKEECS